MLFFDSTTLGRTISRRNQHGGSAASVWARHGGGADGEILNPPFDCAAPLDTWPQTFLIPLWPFFSCDPATMSLAANRRHSTVPPTTLHALEPGGPPRCTPVTLTLYLLFEPLLHRDGCVVAVLLCCRTIFLPFPAIGGVTASMMMMPMHGRRPS